MRQELRDKIIAFNIEYDRINAELKEHGMRLVANAIFKGYAPYSTYMGHMNEYKEIIAKESILTTQQ